MRMPKRWLFSLLPLLVGLTLTVIWQMGCGGGTTTSQVMPSTGSVSTSLTDPPTCGAPNGGFGHVYVTITRVTAHISANAAPTDSGWVDLVDLRNAPKQLDLLSLASTTCILTQLGSTSGLPTGTYQQIRLYLLDNSPASGVATPSPNNCGSAGFNCVVPSGGSPQTLQLSSESQTGIKIPPGQIANGGLTVKAGQSTNLNINFDACASIVQQGNGAFRLKPTLTAGEVAVNTNSISGTVNDNTSNKPVAGAIVLLEQPDSTNVDRVVRAGVTGSDGSFVFCPLPSGNYDVVVAAKTTSATLLTTTYNATVAFKVPLGTALNNIPLVPETTSLTGSSPATLTGQVTTAGTGAAVAAMVTLSALQQATPTGGPNILVTVPVLALGGQPPSVMTTATPTSGPACPAATDCFNYSLALPASNPQFGTFSSGSITYTAPAPGTVTYSLNATAPACTASTPSSGTVGSITVTPGNSTAVSTVLAFTGCTASP